MLKRISFILLLWVCSANVFAIPSQIIIARHGDKWLQPEAKWKTQHASDFMLNAKGMVRSVKLALYYLKTYGKPDYIFATKPIEKENQASGIRPLSTIGPIVSMLAFQEPDGFNNVSLTYYAKNYTDLAKALLTQPEYQDKKILVVWNHLYIPQLIASLGVKQKLQPWESEDFDSIYVLKYDSEGHLASWKLLHHQYPINKTVTWDGIANLGGSED